MNIYLNYLKTRIKEENKYFFLYCRMIENYIKRNPNNIKIKEKHHIYPRCFCEGDYKLESDVDNKVVVSPREHYVLHKVLSKIKYKTDKDRRRMQYAISCFLRAKTRRNLTSRHYEEAKNALVVASRGRLMSQKTKEKLSKILTGKGTFYDENGNMYYLETDDPMISKLSLFGNRKNKVTVKDEKGNTFSVDKEDPILKNNNIVGIRKNIATYVNENGERFNLKTDDPKIKEEDLRHINCGRKFTMPTGHSAGVKNSMYGRKNEVCCFDIIDKIFLRIPKELFDSTDRYVGVNNKIAKQYRNKS